MTTEMKSLMRGEARRSPAKSSEVWLDFEAFLLAPTVITNSSVASSPKSQRGRSRRDGQQWIHTTILACVNDDDCRPVNFFNF